MADPVILVEPDPFTATGSAVASFIPSYRTDTAATLETKKQLASEFGGMDLTEIQAVSRPLNGIAVKPNTHAYVQVIQSNQQVVKVFNQLGMPLTYAQSGSIDGADLPAETAQLARDGKSLHGNLTREGFGHNNDGGSAPPPSLLSTVSNFWDMRTNYNDQSTPPNNQGGMGIDEKGAPAASAWTDWILQSVRESRAEKTQLVETFGDSYLYAFGEKPRVLAFQGMLMNTTDYNWRGVFWENWDKFFRASRLIEMDARIYIGWEDIIVEGYPLQAQCQESATSPNALTFSFNMYVTNYFNVSMANRTAMLASGKLHALGMSRSASLGESRTPATLLDNRSTTFDAFMDLGNLATGGLYKHGISSDGWELDDKGNKVKKMSEIELLAVNSLSKTLNQVSRVATGAHTQNSAQRAGFLNSWLLELSYDAMQAARVGVQDLVAKSGFTVDDQNAWFGYVGTLVENIAESDWGGSVGLGGGGRWGGDDASGSFMDAVRGGSLDRLVQRMAYQAVGLLESGDGDRSAGTLGDYKATGGYMTGGAYPGAAVVTPLQPVNYGSGSGIDLDGISSAFKAGDPFGG